MAIRIGQLETWVLEAHAGLLSHAPHAGWNFSYGAQASRDVALSMPRAVPTYAAPAILPPFDQQVPEMDLGVFSPQLWKEIQPDDMGLLLITSNRRLGRLRFAQPGGTPEELHGIRLSAQQLADIDNGDDYLLEILATLSYVPGISGMQPKTLASLGELEHVRTRIDTHILKGNHRDYPWATVVEHLSLAAAAACGLPVPGNQLSADGRLLAVERFDVRDDTVLGFDEACPLLGLLSAEKYSGSYERMCQQLLRFVAPAARAETAQVLLKQLTLCYAVENGDAHLKNFGLLYDEPADARLSPVYDVLTTTCFAATQRDRPALTLGGRKVWDAYAELERLFGRTLLLPRATIRTIFGEVLDGVRATLPRFVEMRGRFPLATDTLTLAEQAWRRGLERLAAQLAR